MRRGAGRGHHHASTPRTSTPAPGPRRCSGGRCTGVRRESVEIFTKVFWPTGPGRERPRPVPQAHHGVGRRLAAPAADRLRRPVPGAPVRPRDAAGGDDAAFDDLVRQGKALYIGVSEWRAEEIAAALRIAGGAGLDRIVSNQPQYNMIWRVIEAEVIPAVRERGHRPDRLVADRPGRAHRQVPAGRRRRRPGRGPPTRRVRLHRGLPRPTTSCPGAAAEAGRRRGRAEPGPAGGRVGAAEPERVRGDRRRDPPGTGPGERARLRGPARPGADAQDRRDLGPVIERDPARTASPARRD